jgi:hypothetical protein
MSRLTDAEQDEIAGLLLAVLQEHPHRFYTAYYLWYRLGRDRPDLARRLEEAYGEGVGEGGGAHYRATSYISQVLGHTVNVERQWVHADGLAVHGIRASYDEIRLYRWTG